VLGLLAVEVEAVDDLERVAERVTGAELVDDLGEDLADLVFDRVRVGGAVAELPKVREQAEVDELDQVGVGHGCVVVELAVLLRRGPRLPAIRCIEDRRVVPAVEDRSVLALRLEVVEVFEEEQPRGLLGVVELGREPLVVPHDAVYVVECVLEHGCPICFRAAYPRKRSGAKRKRGLPPGS
jgi:hypothetical protein